MISNFHTHTYLCKHAEGDIKDYLEQAKLDSCIALGFSDHCPLPQDNIDNWPEIRMTIEESYDYIKKIRQEAKNYDFPVFAGFECEWSLRYKNFYKDFLLDELKVDYLAFGPHWVEHEGSFVYAPQFGDKKLLHIYTDSMIQAMESGLFSFVAHPDLAMAGWKTWEEEAKSCFGSIIDCAIANNLPLEVNGQGMLKPMMKSEKGLRYQYPYDEFWLLAKEKGAMIIANSDAHLPENVIKGALKAKEFAKNLGIEVCDTAKSLGFLRN